MKKEQTITNEGYQPGYSYFKCEKCDFSTIVASSLNAGSVCPKCAENGRPHVRLLRRIAHIDDVVSGIDRRTKSRG